MKDHSKFKRRHVALVNKWLSSSDFILRREKGNKA